MTTKTIAELFEDESKRLGDGYKTGFFTSVHSDRLFGLAEEHSCLCIGSGSVNVDWYVTRGNERRPVIRVEYLETTYATRKRYRNGYVVNRKCWDNTRREMKFPFTVDGLKAAVDFAKSL